MPVFMYSERKWEVPEKIHCQWGFGASFCTGGGLPNIAASKFGQQICSLIVIFDFREWYQFGYWAYNGASPISALYDV